MVRNTKEVLTVDIKIYDPYAQGSDFYASDFEINPEAIAAKLEEVQAKPVLPQEIKQEIIKEEIKDESRVREVIKPKDNKERLPVNSKLMPRKGRLE